MIGVHADGPKQRPARRPMQRSQDEPDQTNRTASERGPDRHCPVARRCDTTICVSSGAIGFPLLPRNYMLRFSLQRYLDGREPRHPFNDRTATARVKAGAAHNRTNVCSAVTAITEVDPSSCSRRSRCRRARHIATRMACPLRFSRQLWTVCVRAVKVPRASREFRATTSGVSVAERKEGVGN
jgi:hypothetical protein